MSILSRNELHDILVPFFMSSISPAEPEPLTRSLPLQELLEPLGTYLDLLVRWNDKTNLTSVREPKTMVQRHFGESLLAGRVCSRLLRQGNSLLDLGSGAGFPGLPIQLLLPDIRVTLAESQNKKAAFLREAVRALEVQAEVWPSRVQSLPTDKRFDAVTLRAVDNPEQALLEAFARLGVDGWLLQLGGTPGSDDQRMKIPGRANSFVYWQQPMTEK